MKAERFEEISQQFSMKCTRRSVLRGAVGGAMGGAVALFGHGRATLAKDEETTTIYPFTLAQYNTCANELVVINGELHEKTRISSKNGRLHYRFSQTCNGVSVHSDSGAEYIYKSHFGDDLKVSDMKGSFVATQNSTMKLIRLGEDGTEDDLFVHLITTMDVSEAGATVREVQAEYGECR